MMNPYPRGKLPWETPENSLRNLLSSVVFSDKCGNTLGIVTLTWGLAVVLGSFFEYLSPEDCWYTTVAMIIDVIRVYATKADEEFFFNTTSSIKLKRLFLKRNFTCYVALWISLICLTCLLEALFIRNLHIRPGLIFLIRVVMISILCTFNLSKVIRYLLGHTVFQFIPLLLISGYATLLLSFGNSVRSVAMLMGGPAVGSILILCMENNLSQHPKIPSCIQKMLQFIFAWKRSICLLILLSSGLFLVVSLGLLGLGIVLVVTVSDNIQLPMAIARIVLSYKRLSSMDYANPPDNFRAVLIAYYLAIGCKGVIYIFSCTLETSFSHFFRRQLASRSNLLSRTGLKCINLYYEDSYNVARLDGIRVQRNMDLVGHALSSLMSNCYKRKLSALKVISSMFDLLSTPSTPRLVER